MSELVASLLSLHFVSDRVCRLFWRSSRNRGMEKENQVVWLLFMFKTSNMWLNKPIPSSVSSVSSFVMDNISSVNRTE